ncbi:hypothetical protein PIB30_037740 [Stylosanthes scabra]|uniref:Uncharacterized protein n=1 Tax=Stylosanthes scabra TaxID=79078 RepID=A0ABU6SDP2_9FABA|nr:hypothetical protein [Stylosanthes scabra]
MKMQVVIGVVVELVAGNRVDQSGGGVVFGREMKDERVTHSLPKMISRLDNTILESHPSRQPQTKSDKPTTCLSLANFLCHLHSNKLVIHLEPKPHCVLSPPPLHERHALFRIQNPELAVRYSRGNYVVIDAELLVRVLRNQHHVPIRRQVVPGGFQRGNGGRNHSDFRVALLQRVLHRERNDGHYDQGGCDGHQEAAEEGGEGGVPLRPGVVDGG